MAQFVCNSDGTVRLRGIGARYDPNIESFSSTGSIFLYWLYIC